MADFQINKNLPFDKSYNQVLEDLHKWYINILSDLDQMYDKILLDMTTTSDAIHYFASFTNTLLIELEKQLEKATSNEQINIVQERINQIISEIQYLQSLSFHINFNTIKLIGQTKINYNNTDIKSISSLIPISSLSYLNNTSRIISNNKYRFLISRIDAIQMEKSSLSFCHLTSYKNELIHDCVLTFNVSNLNAFLNIFNLYWNIYSNNNEIRMLIPQFYISFIMEKQGEILCDLKKRFYLDEIKIFPNLCPKSDENILLIRGKQHDRIKDCIKDIYFNIEEKNQIECIKLYNPSNLSSDDIQEIMIKNIDYGGFIQNQMDLKTENYSRLQRIEDEKNSDEDDNDDDLWDENDEWWHCQNIRENNSETIQREMIVCNMYASVIIGVNASRINQIKQKTGAYVYINGESSDLKRTVFIKGTRENVDRAYACIENLIERYKNDKLLMKQRRSNGTNKEK